VNDFVGVGSPAQDMLLPMFIHSIDFWSRKCCLRSYGRIFGIMKDTYIIIFDTGICPEYEMIIFCILKYSHGFALGGNSRADIVGTMMCFLFG
jgi:hypothetical protein